MNYTTFTLTELETACGVTLEAVAEQLPLCAVFDDSVWTPVVGPALAKATARRALGAEVEFVSLNAGHRSNFAVYRRA